MGGDTSGGLSIVQILFLGYMALVIIKTILCLSNVGVAAGVLHRRVGAFSKPIYYIIATGLVLVVPMFMIVPLLKQEGLRFFLVYSDRKVIRDTLSSIAH